VRVLRAPLELIEKEAALPQLLQNRDYTYPRVPQFDTEPRLRSDWQMFWIVKWGIRYTGMGAWEGEMSDEKIWMVVTFLSHLHDLPPDLQAEWRGPRR